MTAADADRISLLVRIEGRVQGVWFRGWTVEQARLRGLDGWVRNRSDGTVEALFSGLRDKVDEMVAACHGGPPAALVRTVRAEPFPPPDQVGFRHLPTA